MVVHHYSNLRLRCTFAIFIVKICITLICVYQLIICNEPFISFESMFAEVHVVNTFTHFSVFADIKACCLKMSDLDPSYNL
jgi:hypothetical protein